MSAFDANKPVAVPERVKRVMAMLNRAADAGLRCPTNEEIATAIGAASVSAGANAIALLETMGMIEVERFHQGRRVTVLSTGRATEKVRGPRVQHLAGHKRGSDPIIPQRPDEETLAAFADALAEIGTVSGAARALGIPERQGTALFAVIKADVGRQAA